MSANSPIGHGRFNLEQQRKRAKELLKAASNQQPDAIARLLAHLPVREAPPKLSDAQWVIARENGFASWPKMKAHIDALDFASRHAGLHGDQDARTLHIRCGSDIQHSLKVAGFTGDFLEFSDPFCIGPVTVADYAALMPVRAEFLAGAFGITPADSLARLQQTWSVLERLDDYERLVLWFEHDSYDQLILVCLLHHLNRQRPGANIELVAVDAVPGIERFIGIGQLAPDVLAWLWPQRKPVNWALLQLGGAAWEALCADTPERLMALINSGTLPLPMLGIALKRHLMELPASNNGLSLSEQLTLEILRDLGAMPAGKVFAHLMREREPLPYLGDMMFWWLIQPLLGAEEPAMRIVANEDAQWPQRVLELTPTGLALLHNEHDWHTCGPGERWVGGLKIMPGQAHWRYEHATEQPRHWPRPSA
ncbi:DUF1835 domain-containing protein [Halopseudomonas pelagia]|uniref:DUF1835 domain-containing protein n=1 Tax=Halopseudomonas pelagia TaxID=553151 RepID=UPI00039F4898|nr:DUF1835 domain-containing protein [Halopseudomonas pelagia]